CIRVSPVYRTNSARCGIDAVLVRLGPRGEVLARSGSMVRAGQRDLVVLVVDGQVNAVDARCPHRRGPLAEGVVRDGVVTCPWHWYRFDVRTGECLNAPAYRLRRYAVIERDGDLLVEIPPPEPQPTWSDILRAHARDDRPPPPSSS
ncbi:MAG: Rieske (2Fe-2S) protein, partial [Egibacteraceae bacterium]